MPRNTYGQAVKARVKRLLEALLSFVNCEFEESGLDIEFKWEAEDTSNPKLIVRTTLADLHWLTRQDKHPGELTKPQIRQALKLLDKQNKKNLVKILEDNRTQTQGVDTWHFTLTLWSKDKEKNLQKFENAWEANRPEKSKALEANYQKSEQSDWQNICKIMLEKQKEMTTNRLLDSEMVFDLNQIHVPLALVERKKQDKRQGDDFPDRSHSYKPEYEETQKFEYEEFLAVLKTATNKKIAIIGEPGAGKTTLLQRIAFWVLENTDDLAIWIPLGNLPTTGINFKDYLLNNWLQNTCVSVTSEIKADFDKQLTAGKMWLLLDGVDEMATSGNALSFINNWLPAWSHNLHFVLTCRLNVWEANPNYLSGFQTYRTLQFNQEQVKQFINNCFQTRRGNPPVVAPPHVAPQLGIELQQALNQPGKERIKDLVRNPLRLMLLCLTWHSLDGKLPDTKAELYQHFVDEVYRWKKDELRITLQQRKELNAKLKKLALAAIDKEENRFSLRQKFVESVLGEWDDELFQFALKVGWLNRVGVDARNKPVYAFYHPTFQEYFAALAIEDWRYFLNHVPDNPAQGIYRIFEPQWKEVILLWLGREDVGKEEKEELIKALVDFEDGCGDFYKYRAYFLAAMGIAEFKNCCLADAIVEQIIKFGFGYFNVEKQDLRTFLEPIEQSARAILLQTDCGRAIKGLLALLATSDDKYTRTRAAQSLREIGTGNQQAIDGLVQLVATSEDEDIRRSVVKSLEKIRTVNQHKIEQLVQLWTMFVQLVKTSEDEFTRLSAAESLWKIDPGNQQAIEALVQLVATSEDENIRRSAAENLGKVDSGNQQAVEALVQLVAISEDEDIRLGATYDLGEIALGNQQAIEALVRLLTPTENENIRRSATYSLGEIAPGNQQAIDELVQLLTPTENEDILRNATSSLGKIGIGNQQAIEALVQLVATSENQDIRISAAKNLGKIHPGNQQAIDALVQLVATSENEDIRVSAAKNLGKIDPGNQQAIDALVQLLATSKFESIRGSAADSLKKIVRKNQMPLVVSALQHCLADEVYETNFNRFKHCYNLIWHCAQTIPYADFHKAWHSPHLQLPTTGA